MELPNAGVLYLQSTRNTPDILKILMKTSSEYVVHKVRVMKLKNYSIKDIFEKQLYYLIPFHVLVYKNKLMLYNKDEKELMKLQGIYEEIRDRLLQLGQQDILSEYELGTVIGGGRQTVGNARGRSEKTYVNM